MRYTPPNLLETLLKATPCPTHEAPKDARGIYGLIDHLGVLRYIGSTSVLTENLHKRIHSRHRTGSENSSHYFSRMYNTGRMWRDRNDLATKVDSDMAKSLRNAFVADHCRAVWVVLPDTIDIASLEAEVLAIAPKQAIAWNRRGMEAYAEPIKLVDATIRRLGWGSQELAAIERQRQRSPAGVGLDCRQLNPSPEVRVRSFPKGPFRFFGLDVETANNDRGSICQIGVACVRPDNSIETWVTFVNPRTDVWLWSGLHGITARTVRGAPAFAEVLPVLKAALADKIVYQHSGFDRSAIAAACAGAGLSMPAWEWRDSVQVARAAWPELKGNGGHGLASLKVHLGLEFNHHDAGEDARAAVEVVLRAAVSRPVPAVVGHAEDNDFDLIDDCAETIEIIPLPRPTPSAHHSTAGSCAPGHIGISEITQANIKNNHIYLRGFFAKFPEDAIGGSNRSMAARREVTIDYGGETAIMTDLDGAKMFFRKRGWVRSFFERNGIVAGDKVLVEEIAPYSYRVSLLRAKLGKS